MSADPAVSAPPLGSVVGRNVLHLREARGLTQEELIATCRQRGLRWPRSRLSIFENGAAKDVSLADLLILASGLDATIDQMLAGQGQTQLHGLATCGVPDIRGFLAGRAGVALQLDRLAGPGAGQRTEGLDEQEGNPLEREFAQHFKVPVREIRYSAARLFERPLVNERDRRVGQDLGDLTIEQRAAHRGHVTRALRQEIEADLKSKNVIY